MERVSSPVRSLGTTDAVLVIVGLVIGAGIFRAPSVVAANAGSDLALLLMWIAGGAIALVGALCYAELATTYPSAGGDYHFLHRAFGRRLAFLFGWARLSVMQTGSIALLAYVFGDYASQVAPLGAASPAIYAGLAIGVFTLVNLIGVREGRNAQRVFTTLQIAGVLLIAFAGLVLEAGATPAPAATTAVGTGTSSAAVGLALVFVLLTYGGWNEAAYISAETRGERSIAHALVIGIAVITGVYLLVNLAMLQVLGREGMAASDAVAADLMRAVAGQGGAGFVSLLVAVCALTSINATIITGARSNYALGRDFPALGFLGRWHERAGTPRNALLVQGAIALALVLLGAATRSGFSTLVEFTAPVFWLFFLLTGIAFFVLRRRDPERPRPFRVPAYPLLPLAFCATSAYMLWSSLAYAGVGALVGVATLAVGVPVLWYVVRRESIETHARSA